MQVDRRDGKPSCYRNLNGFSRRSALDRGAERRVPGAAVEETGETFAETPSS